MPKLSIITINYNHLDGLKRTVESVINQTWQEFEYIVIDGGSTDGSAAYIESQSNNIDYWVSEPDSGIYNAMNKGIAKATGEYLLFLNSGDHLFNITVLEKNHAHLVNQDLIYFDWQLVEGKKYKIVPYPDELQFSHLFFGSLPHQATFTKKELFGLVGLYDEQLKIVSDWKFMILALFHYKCSYKHVKETLSTFYYDGISRQVDFSSEREQVLEEYFSEYVLDYKAILVSETHRKMLDKNRFRMLSEIEKSIFGQKVVSVFFRMYLFLFSNKSLKTILKQKNK
jgi:glycosyltransferase involved in cell wall biosynthesis